MKQMEIKLAMADDHAMFRESVAHILMTEYEGIRVVARAGNGQELLDKLSHLNTDELPDVCTLDMDMPKMSGPEALPYLRLHYPDMAILTVSVFDNEHSILFMLRNEARGFISKGADTDELYGAIIALANGGYYHPDFSESRIQKKSTSYLGAELTDKEIHFLQYTITEMTYKEIAAAMSVSVRTVQGYRDALFNKLNIQSRTGLAVFALKSGIYLPK